MYLRTGNIFTAVSLSLPFFFFIAPLNKKKKIIKNMYFCANYKCSVFSYVARTPRVSEKILFLRTPDVPVSRCQCCISSVLQRSRVHSCVSIKISVIKKKDCLLISPSRFFSRKLSVRFSSDENMRERKEVRERGELYANVIYFSILTLDPNL